MPKLCDHCGAKIDVSASVCPICKSVLVDEAVEAIKEEMLLKKRKRRRVTVLIFSVAAAVIVTVGIILGVASSIAADRREQEEAFRQYAVDCQAKAIDRILAEGLEFTNDSFYGLPYEEEEALRAEPAEPYDQVLLFDDHSEELTLDGFDDRLADAKDDLRYVITYRSYETQREQNFYRVVRGSGGLRDRITVSTIVYVVDARSGEVVHIRHVGCDKPPAEYSTRSRGSVLTKEAKEYIASLLGGAPEE